jgi:glycosyltransferase involved in cell wall biosynthesis
MNPLSNTAPILLVGNFLSGSGKARSVSEDLAVQLTGRGWQVLTTSTKPGRLARLFDTLTTIWRLRHQYAVAHVEVYSGWAFRLTEAACWMLRRAGKPYALTLHGGGLPEFARRNPQRVTRLFAAAHTVTAPSRYLLETMQPYRADLRLIPNPLHLPAYAYRPRQQAQPQLVWLRSFHEIYNPSLVPRILAKLVQRHPEARIVMVGPDKGDGSLARMQAVAKELNMLDRIEIPGAVPKAEISNWMNRGDIFLNTTNVDNTPISVLEAMACGLCVVSTNVGGLPYLLANGETALLAPANDADALANAISRILEEPALAAKLSSQGRAEVERFDWSVVLPQWEALFGTMAANQPAVTR